MPVQVKMRGEAGHALWEEGGEFAAHVAAVKKALGSERVKQVASATKGEEIVRALIGAPELKVERKVVNKDRDTALQYKERGNDFFR